MWKNDAQGCLFIPKGKPLALQIRPPWGHVLVGHYRNKEVIVEDAHDANNNNKKICSI